MTGEREAEDMEELEGDVMWAGLEMMDIVFCAVEMVLYLLSIPFVPWTPTQGIGMYTYIHTVYVRTYVCKCICRDTVKPWWELLGVSTSLIHHAHTGIHTHYQPRAKA